MAPHLKFQSLAAEACQQLVRWTGDALQFELVPQPLASCMAPTVDETCHEDDALILSSDATLADAERQMMDEAHQKVKNARFQMRPVVEEIEEIPSDEESSSDEEDFSDEEDDKPVCVREEDKPYLYTWTVGGVEVHQCPLCDHRQPIDQNTCVHCATTMHFPLYQGHVRVTEEQRRARRESKEALDEIKRLLYDVGGDEEEQTAKKQKTIMLLALLEENLSDEDFAEFTDVLQEQVRNIVALLSLMFPNMKPEEYGSPAVTAIMEWLDSKGTGPQILSEQYVAYSKPY